MPNFIEEAKKRAEQRRGHMINQRSAESARALNRQIEIDENRKLNETLAEKARNVFNNTGITVTLEELAKEQNEKRGVDAKVYDSFYQHRQQHPWGFEYEPKFEETSLILSWETDGKQWGRGRDNQTILIDLDLKQKRPVEYRCIYHKIAVVFTINGNLEFQSGTGNITILGPTPESPTGLKSMTVTPVQYLASNDVVARALEAAYKSPYIEHRSIASPPMDIKSDGIG
jgi:hypothetical protein